MHWLARLLIALSILLAGCDRPEEAIGAPQTEKMSSVLQGVRANATLHQELDGTYRLEVLAENLGRQAYRVSSVCVPPWTDAMDAQGEPVDHREPVGSCAAFGLGPFGPGARQEMTFRWDGKVWHEGGPRDAPPGTYRWTATFEFFEEDTGTDRRERITLEFLVRFE